MSDRKLVVHVINSLGVTGGAEQQLVANLNRFSDRFDHHLVCLYARDYGSRVGELPPRVGTTFLFGEHERPRTRLAVLWRLERTVRGLGPALIHCSVAEASLVSRLVGWVRRVPVVESLINISHEPIRMVDNPRVRPWKLWVHRLVDRLTMGAVARFHALSPVVAASWVRTVGLPADRITVAPRGIDGEGLRARAVEADRSELGVGSDVCLVLAVGRQVAQKGHRYLVEAMPRVLEEVPETLLLVAGQPGPMSDRLEALVVELGLTDRVRLLGARDDVPELLGAADVFAFPSLFEGLGVSLLEAMACGLACVTTDRPPMNEIVTHGRTGLLVPPADPPAIAEAVVRLASDPGLRARLGEAARRRVEESYRLEDTARRIEEIYLEVLEGADASGRHPIV